MKCKNCGYDFDKGKYCPECAFPVEEKKSMSEEAIELIRDTAARVKKLEEAEENKRKAREKRDKENEKKGNGDSKAGKQKVGFLDIF